MKKVDRSPKKHSPGTPLPAKHKQRGASAVKAPAAVNAAGLLADLRSLIESARKRIAAVSYSTQTLLCWHLGRRLLSENLQDGRAAYGKQILVTVSRELTAEYGRGFSYAEIARMIQFSQMFPEQPIVVIEDHIRAPRLAARPGRWKIQVDHFNELRLHGSQEAFLAPLVKPLQSP